MKRKILCASAAFGLLIGFSCTPREIRAAERPSGPEQIVEDGPGAEIRSSNVTAVLGDRAYAVEQQSCASRHAAAR